MLERVLQPHDRPKWKAIAAGRQSENMILRRELASAERKLKRIPRLVRWLFGVRA